VAQEVPGRLRPRISLTFRHYKGGRSSAKRTGRLYPRRNPWNSLSEVKSTSGHMVLSGVPRKKSPVTPPGIDPGTVRLVAQCLNHYATPGPHPINYFQLIQTTNINTGCSDRHVATWCYRIATCSLIAAFLFGTRRLFGCSDRPPPAASTAWNFPAFRAGKYSLKFNRVYFSSSGKIWRGRVAFLS